MSYIVYDEDIPESCDVCPIRHGDECPYIHEAHLLPLLRRHQLCPLMEEWPDEELPEE